MSYTEGTELEELKDLCRRVLEHFDMEQGDFPSVSIWHLGDRKWGIVEDELADLLITMYDSVREDMEEEDDG